MKYHVLISFLCLYSILSYGQEPLKDLMIKAEQSKTRDAATFGHEYISDDYSTFLKARAWQVTSRSSSWLSDVNSIDIPGMGGRVRSILVDSKNDIYLAAPSGGGLWRFKPDGSAFKPIDDFGSFMRVAAIAQNPNNKKQIIIGTGDRLHYIPGNGLFISNNKGASFKPVDGTEDIKFVDFVKFHPTRASELYIVSIKDVYRMKSGQIEKIHTADNRVSSIDFNQRGDILISVRSVGLQLSKTGAKNSFKPVKGGVPYSATKKLMNNVVAAHAKDPSVLYSLFAMEDPANSDKLIGEVFKSTNGGESWQKMGKTNFGINAPYFAFVLGVHPTKKNVVIAGSLGHGYSLDGGKTWVRGAGLEVDYHHIGWDLSSENYAYIGYDQGIGQYDFRKEKEYSIWNGSEYVKEKQILKTEIGKKAGFNTSQIYRGDFYPARYGDALVFGQQDGGSFATVNDITRRILVGDGGSIFVHKQKPNKIIGSTQYGRLRRSNKGLEPYYRDFEKVDVPSQGNFITNFGVNQVDGDQIYYPTENAILRSKNFGESFRKIASHELKSTIISVEAKANPTVIMTGYKVESGKRKSYVMVIKQAGGSPKVKKFALDEKVGVPRNLNFDPNDSNRAYLVDNYGRPWAIEFDRANGNVLEAKSLKEADNNVYFVNVIGIPNQPGVLLAGTHIGLFYSTDKGKTWELNDQIPYANVTDLRYREEDNRLFVFTYGRGAWAANINLNPVNNDKRSFSRVKIYPNPALDRVYIDMEGPFQAIMFDIDGKKVFETSRQENQFNLPAGPYILHIYQKSKLVGVEKLMIK